MTNHITIPRALLEQALEVILLDTTGRYAIEAAIRAELAKPPTPAEPFAYTTGAYAGRFTVEPVNRATVIPAGIALYLHQPTKAQHDAPEVAALKAERDALLKGIEAVEDLIQQSHGIVGLHLNGDIAQWDDLRTGGEFEEWLIDFDAAIAKAEGRTE